MRIKGAYEFAQKPTCPHCQLTLDEAVGPPDDPRGPQAGDIILCARCGGLSRLLERGNVRKLTAEEQARIERMQGGLPRAMAHIQRDQVRRRAIDDAVKDLLYKRVTGHWPWEDGIRDDPVDL